MSALSVAPSASNARAYRRWPSVEPRPANHTDADYMSTLEDDHLVRVITGGTISVEKSNLCPPWGQTFSEDRIKGLAVFVRSLSLVPEEGPVEEAAGASEGIVAEGQGGSIVGAIIRWIIIALVCGGVIAGALFEWKIISWKKK